MRGLQEQVIVITGAANGIGREIARQLGNLGCNLALVDIDENALQNLKQEFAGKFSRTSFHITNIADESLVKSLVDNVIQTHGRVSIVINNAGVSLSAPFEMVDTSDFRWVFETNFWGAVYLCKHFLPYLRNETEAKIVNVISDFALLGFPNKTAYCASKSALLGFSNALYTELYETNIKVTVVVPPAVDTGLIRNGKAFDEIKKQKEADFVKRNGMPVEVVARQIIQGLQQNSYKIEIGLITRLLDVSCRWFPTLTHKFVAINKARIDFLK